MLLESLKTLFPLVTFAVGKSLNGHDPVFQLFSFATRPTQRLEITIVEIIKTSNHGISVYANIRTRDDLGERK